MKKLALSLDDLHVESFSTSGGKAPRGTVQGLDSTAFEDTCNSCGGTCDVNNATPCGPCNPQYPDTDGGPVWSSVYTDCGNCRVSYNEVGTCVAPCTR